jgi:hypothetical protein
MTSQVSSSVTANYILLDTCYWCVSSRNKSISVRFWDLRQGEDLPNAEAQKHNHKDCFNSPYSIPQSLIGSNEYHRRLDLRSEREEPTSVVGPCVNYRIFRQRILQGALKGQYTLYNCVQRHA